MLGIRRIDFARNENFWGRLVRHGDLLIVSRKTAVSIQQSARQNLIEA
jgi:hypothetical protein